MVLVPKKDGKPRFCVDCRLQNAVFKRDSYQFPRMDECIDSLCETKVFSTLNCNAGYWQVLIADGAREKTAFVCHKGADHYKCMPFGLTNAPATFQRALDIILFGVKWQSCLVYIDDVIVYSKTHEEHIQHLDDVLGLLRAAGGTLKLRKCRFFRTTVKYLGHEITPGRLGVLQAHTKAPGGGVSNVASASAKLHRHVQCLPAVRLELRAGGHPAHKPHGLDRPGHGGSANSGAVVLVRGAEAPAEAAPSARPTARGPQIRARR